MGQGLSRGLRQGVDQPAVGAGSGLGHEQGVRAGKESTQPLPWPRSRLCRTPGSSPCQVPALTAIQGPVSFVL